MPNPIHLINNDLAYLEIENLAETFEKSRLVPVDVKISRFILKIGD